MLAEAIILAKRPSGRLAESDFATATLALPDLKGGEVLLAARYLSIDPYLRGMMDEAPFVGASIPLGGVIAGRGIAEVVQSASPAFQPGQFVFGDIGWRSHGVLPATALRPVAQNAHPLTWQLGVLGIPGITALLALDRIAAPRKDETVVVSSAAGTVGMAAGQIAKARGCKVVGLAGTTQKVVLLREQLGFDGGIDYRTCNDLGQAVAAVFPQGVDIYFDNVGGKMLDTMLPVMKPQGRIAICGYMSDYDSAGGRTPLSNYHFISLRRLRVQGFSVRDHVPDHAAALRNLNELADAGQLRQVETICEGLADAPRALIGLLQGHMTGKVIVACTPT